MLDSVRSKDLGGAHLDYSSRDHNGTAAGDIRYGELDEID